jgi:hypothetical protein
VPGADFALATHDGLLREALLTALGRQPVEQLLGVRAKNLDDLVARGIPSASTPPTGGTGSGYWMRRLAEPRGLNAKRLRLVHVVRLRSPTLVAGHMSHSNTPRAEFDERMSPARRLLGRSAAIRALRSPARQAQGKGDPDLRQMLQVVAVSY